jgi:hypothetical protein
MGGSGSKIMFFGDLKVDAKLLKHTITPSGKKVSETPSIVDI